MIRVGFLISSRDYFVPYINWALDKERSKCYNISGFLVDDHSLFDKTCLDYEAHVKFSSLEETIEASDLIVSLGYWKIISKQDLERVPLGIINLHHSYKLKYRGRHCATWAIRNGEKVHGSTLHYMNESLDDGPIIDSMCCDITKDDTAGSLFEKVNQLGLRLLDENINDVCEGKLKEFKSSAKDFYTYRAKDLSLEINPTFIDDAKKLYDQVRAVTFPNKPKPYMLVGNKKITMTIEEAK